MKLREVRFELYCRDCKHYEKDETEDPCNECLGIGAREGTNKPEYFEDRNK